MLDQWIDSWDQELWSQVPVQVARLVTRYATPARKTAAIYSRSQERVYWNPVDGRSAIKAPPSPDYLLVKRAGADFLKAPADLLAKIQKPLSGPNPLTATLVGGALGSGLGYAGGALAEQILPEEQFERGKLRKTMAMAGAGLGAAPGLAWSGATLMNGANHGMAAPESLVSPWPFQKKSEDGEVDPRFLKAADSGAMFYSPTIPVNAFNQALWSDAVQPSNPYGTKNPWGSNEQPLTTPPWAAAAASGIVAGTGAATGQESVSPWQVAQTAAASAGVGYLAASVFGKTLGALAGLRPEAQDRLRDLGLWGGLVSGAVSGLFGGR